MLNTHKLLYILPDLAYIAELLPAKKEYTFTIQAFRQINGEFVDETELIPTSIEKLFTKLEKEEYHLILPDFLFTNTIITVEGTSESKVLEHVNTVLLPTLELSKDTHEIEITVLTSFKGNSKVQISAIEKNVLAPIRAAAQKSETTITAVSPLTWAVKAIISLEPSISILQMGSQLYTALHYIGVDQTNNFPVDDYEAIFETVKTLKGSEPSVQSVYLASSSLVEEDIKEKLSDTLPIQQVVSFKEEDSKMPSYIKHIIESTMRTLSIPDFPVPQFKLGKATEEDILSLSKAPTNKTTETDDEELDSEITKTALPQPSKIELSENNKEKTVAVPEKDVKTAETEADLDSKEPQTISSSKTMQPASIPAPIPVSTESLSVGEAESLPMTKDMNTDKSESSTKVTAQSDSEKAVQTPETELPAIPEIDTKPDSTTNKEAEIETAVETESPKKTEIDLSQFAGKDTETDVETANTTTSNPEEKKMKAEPVKILDKPQKKVIKNSSGVNNMLKMVFITIAVFFITIAIGVGVGLGLLKLSENKPAEVTTPVVTETPEPTATPTPTPEPMEINKAELSILVVNATTKAGYAGTIKKLLTDAEITDVTAGNAKGEYETDEAVNDLLLLKEENPDLLSLIEESTDLTLEYSSDIDVEDPTGKYDAVIVLVK